MDIDITGARILISRPEWGGFMLTETVVVTWVVMLILVLACRFMTAHLEVHPTKKRQVIAEWIVTSIRDMVQTNMGEKYVHTWYVPFIGAMFALSAGCSLSSVVGAYAPTSDLSTVLGWALFVFALITITKIKTNGFGGYLLGFTTPIPVMTPFNIIGEIATPVSMAFRHFGNIVSGSVITALVYAALIVANRALFGIIPGIIGKWLGAIPFLTVGVPAVISLYFDWFGSFMQAFIFCMLTMMYISTATD